MDMKVIDVIVSDVRFPTSLNKHGSDAMHTDPDYSCAYVILKTEQHDLEGHGLTFTIGKGTEVICKCVESLKFVVMGHKLGDIFNDFASFWRKITSDPQLRWIGPEKGVTHMAASAIINALWDLWAKIEGKPLWKLLVDMDPKLLASTIDFRYMSDVITKEEAISFLEEGKKGAQDREKQVRTSGYPAYTTSIGWLGYSDDQVIKRCRDSIAQGFNRFKAKVGQDLEQDKKRLALIRKEIGPDRILAVDANQTWEVMESIYWMEELAQFRPYWIEEPTSPDDVLGHLQISTSLKKYGIGVATGEHCCNRVMFKQLLKTNAIQFCQVDACRLGGVNEVIAVMLMAKKMGIPVCPHAGGVGLCYYVQHLALFDFISLSKSLDNRMTEYCDLLHEHFEQQPVMKNGCYVVPDSPGYCGQMKRESILEYSFPDGPYWKKALASGKH